MRTFAQLVRRIAEVWGIPLAQAAGRQGSEWLAVGTPAALLEANLEAYPARAAAATASVARGASVRRTILRPGASVAPGAVVEDALILEGTHIGPGAHVRRAIVGPSVRIAAGARVGPPLKNPRTVTVLASAGAGWASRPRPSPGSSRITSRLVVLALNSVLLGRHGRLSPLEATPMLEGLDRIARG